MGESGRTWVSCTTSLSQRGENKGREKGKKKEADWSLAAEEAAALASIQTHQYQEIHKTHKCTSQTRENSSCSETEQICSDFFSFVEHHQITLGSLAGTSVSRLIILPSLSLFMAKSWKPRKQKLEFFTSSARPAGQEEGDAPKDSAGWSTKAENIFSSLPLLSSPLLFSSLLVSAE